MSNACLRYFYDTKCCEYSLESNVIKSHGVISFDFWYLSLFNKKKKQELEMCSKDTDAHA